MLLLPAPDGDALVQRAADVGLQVRRQHRVEMDVRVNQRARDEPARAVDRLAGLGRDPRLHGHDALAFDGDVGRAHRLVLVRDERVLQNDVHTRLPPCGPAARVIPRSPAFSPKARPFASRTGERGQAQAISPCLNVTEGIACYSD